MIVLLDVPYLKLVAGVLLLAIALRLTLERGDRDTVSALDGRRMPWRGSGFAGAVVAIMVANAVMSLDNVVATAAVADGSLWLLGFGLALSIPVLVYGSAIIRRFLGDNGGWCCWPACSWAGSPAASRCRTRRWHLGSPRARRR